MKIVALVLAGGEGTRLYPLTAEHSKPALPFANGYRIVDFVLSNLVNSKISTIYMLAQYKPDSLMRHVAAAWAPWFNAPGSAIKVLLPRSNRQLSAAPRRGAPVPRRAAGAFARRGGDLRRRPRVPMDVRQMIDFHWRARPTRRWPAVGVPLEKASSFGIISAGATAACASSTRSRGAPRRARAIRRRPTRPWATTSSTRVSSSARSRKGIARGESISAATCCRGCAGRPRVYAY
jgi:glucose-1-phosphate adenylyltransferase